MASQKKPSKRNTELPAWGDEVKPSDDVMAMFYAPTGTPKPGPIVPVKNRPEPAPPVQPEHPDRSESAARASAVSTRRTGKRITKPNPSQVSPAQPKLTKSTGNTAQLSQPSRSQPSPTKPNTGGSENPLSAPETIEVKGLAIAEEKFLPAITPVPPQPIPPRPIPSRPNPAQLELNRLLVGATAELFPGTSRKLYEALLLRTHAVSPATRTVQATKRELMHWSGIRSKNTIALHLQHLTTVGLLVRQLEIGSQAGSVYEVRLPAELAGGWQSTEPDQPQPISSQLIIAQPSLSHLSPAHPSPSQLIQQPVTPLAELIREYWPDASESQWLAVCNEIEQLIARRLAERLIAQLAQRPETVTRELLLDCLNALIGNSEQ